jgi:hypothetical protein
MHGGSKFMRVCKTWCQGRITQTRPREQGTRNKNNQNHVRPAVFDLKSKLGTSAVDFVCNQRGPSQHKYHIHLRTSGSSWQSAGCWRLAQPHHVHVALEPSSVFFCLVGLLLFNSN